MKKMKILVTMLMVIAFAVSVNAQPNVGDIAKTLGKMTSTQMMKEFKRLGEQMEIDPGPMPGDGQSECIAGPFIGNDFYLGAIWQWFIYNFIWGGKTFHEDSTKPCSDQYDKRGHYWLTNKLKTIALILAIVPNGTKAWVYRSMNSWNNDGLPTIYIDYGPSLTLSWWVHDEIRFAGTNPNDTVCYLGVMWMFLGPIRIPFAYFIPDQVNPSYCDM